ncbi:uncharacterized protein A4U43_C04F25690 [Asparagus officinalis]|uniref:Uncharacterized protein n=1 Tax=Asparagus officinalis TaxID=4686 RepID=A0A5P1F8K0_ASPOF|nr:uncharacterized protein A4U43_C04F25690 [Asparagus officinalis]
MAMRGGQLSQAASRILLEDYFHLQHDLGLPKQKVKYLKDEVQVEKKERDDAFEWALVAHLNVEDLKGSMKFEEAQRESLGQEAAQIAQEASE